MTRILIALAAATFLAAPAVARDSGCAAAPQIRSAAASAAADAQGKALRHVATAEKLCDAGNDRAGKAKLELAAKALGVDMASLAAPAAASGQ